jgi:hypothetical protein
MHWQTIIYCLDNNVSEVCDGSNQEMKMDPSQNEVILEEMRLLYKEFGINYFNPVFYESRERRERTLFDLGLTPIQRPKDTRFSWERQPFCSQVYLFGKFFDYMCTNWQGKRTSQRQNRYLKSMFTYHRKKREFIKHEVYKYLKQNGTQEICIR